MNTHDFIVPKILECNKYTAMGNGFNSNKQWRIVNNYELDYNLSGERTMYVDGVKYTITPGTIICRRPGQTVASVGTYNMYTLTLDFSNASKPVSGIRNLDTHIQPLYKSYFWDVIPIAFEPIHASEIGEIYRRLEYLSKQPERIKETNCFLSELLHLIVADAYAARTSSNNPGVVDKLLVYMHENFTRRITLEELAKLVHLNKSYMIRLFRKNTDLTPIAYLNKFRISNAKKILFNSDCPISEVSSACGFENEAYFIYCFRRECGITPETYRRKKRTL